MDCFQIESRLSDHLDGLLNSGEKRAADDHLSTCDDCREKHQRYRVLLTSISEQPRSSLPVPIRKAHDRGIRLRRLERGWIASGRTRWQRLPWYTRSTLEGLGIVTLILATVSMAPRIRSLYERSIERSLKDLSDPQEATQNGSIPPLTKMAAAGAGATTVAAHDHAGGDDIEIDTDAEGDEGSESAAPAHSSAASTQIWRFHIKTESPYEARARIAQMLTALLHAHGGAGASAIGGTEAPGGIQFDLFLPEGLIPEVKSKLEKMAAPSHKDSTGQLLGENFTWYRSRSRNPAPAGKSRVVIWLSQI